MYIKGDWFVQRDSCKMISSIFGVNRTRITKAHPWFDLIQIWPVCIWGPFLESPVNFSGPKSNIQIEIKRIRARVLASKLLYFVSLNDSFILLDAKLLKPRSLMETETAYQGPVSRKSR